MMTKWKVRKLFTVWLAHRQGSYEPWEVNTFTTFADAITFATEEARAGR